MSDTNGIATGSATDLEGGRPWSKRIPWVKLVVLFAVVGLFSYLFLNYRDALTLKRLAEQESQLRNALESKPVLVYAAAFAIYVAVTGLSLPGAAVLTVACGWVFGLVRGTILVSFASTSGATLAFLMSRYFLGSFIQQKFAARLQSFNAALDREGAFYLFSLRLIPAVPFFVINVVMGLTRIKTRTFLWVSQLGMLAGTAVYVGAGAAVPDLATLRDQGLGEIFTWKIGLAFVIFGIFPIVVKKLFARFRQQDAPAQSEEISTPGENDSPA